jgi:hypothetical protein
VSELTQPLAAAPQEESTAVGAADAQERARALRSPTFTELVYGHFAWWHALRGNGAGRAAAEAYQEALLRFQAKHGEIVDSYWCTHVESAVALTAKPRSLPWSSPRLGFHRETDWATKNHPDIACQLHRCDELAVRAVTVLNGVRQRICLQLVVSAAGHLLSLVDARAAHEDEAKTAEALQQECAQLDKADEYYRGAANGQAQIVYFAGMVSVAAVIAIAAGLSLAISWASPVAALIAGSIGAVVSVIQRINAGHFELDYDVGRPYAFFLGALRPLIGGAFALAIAFAFTSGILHLPLSSSDPGANKRLALLVISFVAGFSERWAQDTLAAALPTPAQQPRPEPPAPAASGGPPSP